MRPGSDQEHTSDELGLHVGIDATLPLPELTARLNAACDQVEEPGRHTVLRLLLHPVPAHRRPWPARVDVRDVNRWERAVRRLEKLPAMIVSTAEGICGGPALDLLLASDFRIGDPGLLLMLPVNDGHFWPGMAVYRLAQQLGTARARQIVLWGDDLDARRAHEVGLIDQLSEDLTEAAHTAVVLMGRISDRELAVRRQLLLEAPATEFQDALGAHLAACDRELRRLAESGHDERERS
ncbi:MULTISPECIES: enoyl-CoA-hydratase DpgB [unclassified Streptomyces]|uniref:enoyl-CoA-hydratase DpgB n=1 Tax=unclassified Streptomyces TaxID=2593676 RepID=UPI001F1726D3|nr:MULTISPECIES: enoyl-CoA-hydratase DpgB [unclassified Streptomyces]MCF0085933.1 Enoyl-CoA-hydratase [Streptomyces sp. MH192]MCF0098337.1 Enoyl-CoA-hydratase [Streptomyces sp. MH191]